MHFEWDEHKNKQLKTNRAVCFEDVFIAISEKRLLDILPHHNPEKYPNQKLFIQEKTFKPPLSTLNGKTASGC